jgi:small-conductance mechanosensitive channel
VGKTFTARQGMLAGKFIFYGGTILITTMVLQQLGFRLTALLGAAGIAGIAVGFASQTSVSNIIGGLFLIVDNPFSVGEVVKVGDVTGEVLALDLLSVRIRTFDNKLVRIPNETLVKATVTNYSRFPIRRVDLDIAVAYKEDLARVKTILLDVAEKNPLCLAEPEPTLLFSKFGDSAVEIFLGVWAQSGDYGAVKNALMSDVKKRFEAEGVEIPFPTHVVRAPSAEEPIAVRVEGGKGGRTSKSRGR